MSHKSSSDAKRLCVTLDFTDHEAAYRLYDEAFQHPDCLYVVTPIDAEAARAWMRENAYMLNFGWVGARPFQEKLKELGAMRYGQHMHMDTLYYRDRCGWVPENVPVGAENNGYLCDYPPGKGDEVCRVTHKRLCHTYQCPIALRASDEEEDGEDDDMILYRRPRYAYVSNVLVQGCEQVFG